MQHLFNFIIQLQHMLLYVTKHEKNRLTYVDIKFDLATF